MLLKRSLLAYGFCKQDRMQFLESPYDSYDYNEK